MKQQRLCNYRTIMAVFLIFSLFFVNGCNVFGYFSYIMFGSGQSKVKATYESLENKKVLILLKSQAGMEYGYPQSRTNLILACQQILKANIENVSFCDHELVENFLLRELDWISMPTDTLAKRFGAERVIYIDLFKFTLQDSDSIGIYQGQAEAEVKIYETDNENPNKPVKNFNFALSYPEKHPVAATPENKYLVLSGTINQTAYEICKNFFSHKKKD